MATALQSAAYDMIVVDDISGRVPRPNRRVQQVFDEGVGATEKAYVITKMRTKMSPRARNIERVVQADVRT